MQFTKMHGLGNDYIYVYSDSEPQNPETLSVQLSERRFGVGSDGMIWILPSAVADFKMRIFNADGSEAMMCGNGIRCVGKYVFDKGYTDKTRITVETLSGIKTLELFVDDGKVNMVSVQMGKAVVGKPETVEVCGKAVRYVPVSVGNPHAVVFVDDAQTAPLETVGATLERHPNFPGGINVEFVQLIDRQILRMRVWERGSGITMACGTGACAAAAAAVCGGLCSMGEDISLRLDGGTLHICVAQDYSITMTGPAQTIYEGETVK